MVYLANHIVQYFALQLKYIVRSQVTRMVVQRVVHVYLLAEHLEMMEDHARMYARFRALPTRVLVQVESTRTAANFQTNACLLITR